MRIQIARVDLERLLINTPGGASIGIDTVNEKISVIDETGRELGIINAKMKIWQPET